MFMGCLPGCVDVFVASSSSVEGWGRDTSSNYFSWKSRMEDVLRSRRLFRITSRKETEPTDDDKKIKWENKCDEACGFIGMSISTDL